MFGDLARADRGGQKFAFMSSMRTETAGIRQMFAHVCAKRIRKQQPIAVLCTSCKQYMGIHTAACTVDEALPGNNTTGAVGVAYLDQKLQVEALGALVLPHSNGNDAAQQSLHG